MRKHIISLFLFISILLGALSFNFPVYADVSPAYEMTGIFRYVHEGWRSSGVVLPITEAKKYMDSGELVPDSLILKIFQKLTFLMQ